MLNAAMSSVIRALLYLFLSLYHNSVSATTRYLPTDASSLSSSLLSHWLSLPSPISSTMQQLPEPPSSLKKLPSSAMTSEEEMLQKLTSWRKPSSSETLPSSAMTSEEEVWKKLTSRRNPSSSEALPSSAMTSEDEVTSSRKPSSVGTKALRKDLRRLSRLLPGVYSNSEQYQQEAEVGREVVPNQQKHMLLRSSYRPVSLRFMPRAFAVLVQDYSGDSLFPFRQRVHTFTPDPSHRAIRMKVWDFATHTAAKRASRNLRRMSKLRRKDLLSRGSCDMFWRRLDRASFVGITGEECLGYVRGEQVRIRVSMTLTKEVLQTREAWYRSRDGKKLVHTDGPYNLLKTKSFLGGRKQKKQRAGKVSRKGWRERLVLNELPSLPSPPSPRRIETLPPTLPPTMTPTLSPTLAVTTAARHNSLQTRPSHHSREASAQKAKPLLRTGDNEKSMEINKDFEWLLPDYQAIASALKLGRLVYYSVELSACSTPQQLKAKRLSFGDFVDTFEISSGSRRRDPETIRFGQTKFVEGDEGMEAMRREIIIQSNGRVDVRLHRQHVGTNKLVWDQTVKCRLFDYNTGMGGVKMTSRPQESEQEMRTFGRFRSSLRRGRRQVRMIIDFSQCQGRLRGTTTILGSTVRAYDFINSGKAVEISQLIPDRDPAFHTLLTGQFLDNGEVVFIASLKPRPGTDAKTYRPLLHRPSTFRCALSGSDVTNSNAPWGVRLFYTT